MNPYRHDLLLAGMLAAPERFIGLRDELEWILATISAERPAAVSLVGPWGFGKTLMLGYLAHPDGARRAFGGSIGTRFRAAPEYLLFVTLPLEYVEFDERGRFNLFEQLYTQAMRTLATLLDIADLHLIRFDDIPPPLPMNLAALRSMIGRARDRLFDEEGSRPPAAPEPSSPVSWHYRLIELLNHLTGWGFRPIFILDSFDTIIGHLNLDDFEQLRALLPHASLITATRRALSEIVHTDIQSSPFFNLIQRLMLMPITFLPADEARRMIHEPPGWFAESAGFSWSDSDTAFILELTGQHLDLIRGACEQLYMWANPRRSTAHTDQLPLAQRPLLRAQLGMTFAHAFAALWHLLTPAERTILQDVATGMPLTGVA
ncbi:MAG TPA: hypothetical protein PKA05_00690, partial [Roseiflexaceae bacterium]|nr:hypothetical protein [Roseiflexaceae bacterium]